MFNKPRVFLSHAAKDKGFIEPLADDLRKCQIEPWLDTEEIRDGKPWLDVIFEDGIPTCDAVIVYFTKNSLESKMVKKEINAALIEQLADGGIRFLPYVSDEALRSKLRSDIRSLHCREWNDGNYKDILPSIVSEIWRSFMERTVNVATLNEKNKRLEFELEVNKLKEHNQINVFSANEESEFKHIFKKLNRNLEVSFNLFQANEKSINEMVGKDIIEINLLQTIFFCLEQGYYEFKIRYFEHEVRRFLGKAGFPESDADKKRTYSSPEPFEDNIEHELLVFGLTKIGSRESLGRQEKTNEFTDKIYRFKYWLEYNKLIRTKDLGIKLLKYEEITVDLSKKR